MADVDEMGPIDYLVVEFPNDREPDGSALGILRRLVEDGVINVLDLAFVRVGDDGSVASVNIADVGLEGIDITLFAEAPSGLLDEGDLAEAGGARDRAHRRGARLRERAAASSRVGCAVPAPSWWRTAGSRSRPSSLPSTRSTPLPDPKGPSTMPGLLPWSGPHGRRGRHRDRRLEPGVTAPGKSLGREGPGRLTSSSSSRPAAIRAAAGCPGLRSTAPAGAGGEHGR